jgi:hypothetical protein
MLSFSTHGHQAITGHKSELSQKLELKTISLKRTTYLVQDICQKCSP